MQSPTLHSTPKNSNTRAPKKRHNLEKSTYRNTSAQSVRHGDIGLVRGYPVLLTQRLKLPSRQIIKPQRGLRLGPPERRHRCSKPPLQIPFPIKLCSTPPRESSSTHSSSIQPLSVITEQRSSNTPPCNFRASKENGRARGTRQVYYNVHGARPKPEYHMGIKMISSGCISGITSVPHEYRPDIAHVVRLECGNENGETTSPRFQFEFGCETGVDG